MAQIEQQGQGLTLADRDPFSLLFTFSPLRLCGNDATSVFGGHFLAFKLVVCYAPLPAIFLDLWYLCFCLRCRLQVIQCRIRLLFGFVSPFSHIIDFFAQTILSNLPTMQVNIPVPL